MSIELVKAEDSMTISKETLKESMPRTEVLENLAKLLDYPESDLLDTTNRCLEILPKKLKGAHADLEIFRGYVQDTPALRMEEIYTTAFDINPACYPYAGYQLFGESYKRGEFLAALKGKYMERGFDEGKELADHLKVIFRFLSGLEPGDTLSKEIVEDCLMPAVDKMFYGFTNQEEAKANPYHYVLKTVFAVIKEMKGGKL